MILFLLLDRMERFWKSLGVMLWHSRNRMVLLFRVEGCGLPLKRGVIQPGILLHLLLYWKWGRERLCVFRPFLSHTAGRLWIINRSEEHTSELQSRGHLVCRRLLEK